MWHCWREYHVTNGDQSSHDTFEKLDQSSWEGEEGAILTPEELQQEGYRCQWCVEKVESDRGRCDAAKERCAGFRMFIEMR